MLVGGRIHVCWFSLVPGNRGHAACRGAWRSTGGLTVSAERGEWVGEEGEEGMGAKRVARR